MNMKSLLRIAHDVLYFMFVTTALILFHTIALMEKLLKMYIITKAELKAMDMSLTVSYGRMKIFLLKYRESLRPIYLVKNNNLLFPMKAEGKQ
ncbi:hypothetical protein V1478_000068 [Vespula squamosa]|uniref:Uncharacterized protein n=1 Tax=Vespula squamosa TaxID=30214 RepID=A0ABD2C9T0_VESSQ